MGGAIPPESEPIMSLLNRLALSSNDKARELATRLRNNADVGLHQASNDSMLAQVWEKINALPQDLREKAIKDLGL